MPRDKGGAERSCLEPGGCLRAVLVVSGVKVA